MESTLKQPVSIEDLRQLIKDVKLMKEILLSGRLYADSDGELSDWAKKELAEARAENKDSYISLDNLKKEIENGL